MVKLIYSTNALSDLKSIHDFIANDSPANAKRFIYELRNRITFLKQHPEFGFPAFPNKFKNLRQILYKSYRIIYLYESSTISVVTIIHQHRLPESIPVLSQFE